jgi:hypothetical protein
VAYAVAGIARDAFPLSLNTTAMKIAFDFRQFAGKRTVSHDD